MSDDQTKEGGLERLLHVLCDLSAAFGCVILVAMAGMTVVSVVGRAFFEHPILGDVELVQLGCAVVVAAFLPYAQFKRANIIVDFFTTRASPAAQRWMDGFGTLLYACCTALIAWRVYAGGVMSEENQEVSMLMSLPIWIPYMLMVPGFVLCTLVGLYQTYQYWSGGAKAGDAS